MFQVEGANRDEGTELPDVSGRLRAVQGTNTNWGMARASRPRKRGLMVRRSHRAQSLGRFVRHAPSALAPT